MQSRIVAIRSRLFFSAARTRLPPWSRATNSCANRPGYTAAHSEDLPGEEADEAAKASMAQEQQHPEKGRGKSTPSSRTVPYAPSLKLENSSVINLPFEPTFQQKRSSHASATAAIDGVDCVCLDGMPADDEQREEEDDNIAYYREHKPSPLSEVEFVDTRVPLRRATDGGADDDEYVGVDVIGWREEQMDTAEAVLLRAEAMFREAAERGDPDSPHGRVLRAFKEREGQLL